MYKHNVEIVVARYNENLSWLNEYPFNLFEYIVYNKGDNEDFVKTNVNKIVKLNNVGRCDHTYLYHIIDNYDNLSNIVVFFPGSVNLPNKKPKAIKILINIIRSNYQSAFFCGTYHKRLVTHLQNFTMDNYKCCSNENFIKNSETKTFKCKYRPYGLWYKMFFGNTNAHWLTYGGVFSIDKRDIKQHDINKYKYIIQTVSIHSNPEAGHYIERSWGAMFYPLVHTVKIKE